jgi:hypothetical protein
VWKGTDGMMIVSGRDTWEDRYVENQRLQVVGASDGKDE